MNTARIELFYEDRVERYDVEIPGDGAEGLFLIEELEKRTNGRIPNPARDRRFAEMMARRAK